MKIKVVAVILAAGEGRRVGQPKAMLRYGPRVTFLDRLSRVFKKAGCVPLAVLGSRAGEIARAHPAVRFAVNRRWRRGQFSSVRVGLRAAMALEADWIAIHPVDMPLLRASTVRRLQDQLGKSGNAVMPSYQRTPGHPLLLSVRAARRVLRISAPHLEAALAHFQPRIMPIRDRGTLININTLEDYKRFFLQKSSPAGSRGRG